MARRRHSRRRKHRRRVAPSASIVGYTRAIDLEATSVANGATSLVTADVPDVVTPPEETVNRKIIRISGQCFFTAGLSAGQYALAQFCLWAHPKHEGWPAVSAYDPFNEGPGESAFEGLLSPRTFARRTFVLAVPQSGSAQTISDQHMLRSAAERLLRPGWVLTAGLYLKASAASVSVRHTSLLRYVVAG